MLLYLCSVYTTIITPDRNNNNNNNIVVESYCCNIDVAIKLAFYSINITFKLYQFVKTKSPFSDHPPSGYYYSFRLSIHCINCSLFILRKLYHGGTGRIPIRYFYTRVNTSINTILRSTRLDKSPGKENFQI